MAFIGLRHGKKLAEMPYLRNAVIVTFVLAFGAAAIAGLFGALITKAARIHEIKPAQRLSRHTKMYEEL